MEMDLYLLRQCFLLTTFFCFYFLCSLVAVSRPMTVTSPMWTRLLGQRPLVHTKTRTVMSGTTNQELSATTAMPARLVCSTTSRTHGKKWLRSILSSSYFSLSSTLLVVARSGTTGNAAGIRSLCVWNSRDALQIKTETNEWYLKCHHRVSKCSIWENLLIACLVCVRLHFHVFSLFNLQHITKWVTKTLACASISTLLCGVAYTHLLRRVRFVKEVPFQFALLSFSYS